MELNEFYKRMREEIAEFSKVRDESAAFLIWFLKNFFRLEEQDAVDSVCDHKNDKGIDGIYVDDEEEVIYLFQSKFSPNDDQDQGDNDIRNFVITFADILYFRAINLPPNVSYSSGINDTLFPMYLLYVFLICS